MKTPGTGLMLLAGLAAVFAGCGGGSTKTVTASQTAQAENTTTQTTTASSPADIKKALTPEGNRQARSMLVTINDVPTGWREDTSPDKNDKTKKCPGLDFASLTAVGKADGHDLTDDDSAGKVSSFAVVLDSPAAAENAQQQISSDATRRCLTSSMDKELKKSASDGATIGDVQSGRMSFPNVGDKSTALRLAIPVEVRDST